SYAWEWDATLYPDLPEDIARLHDRGFSFLAYFNPFVPAPTRMFAEGTAGGWLVEDADGEVITFLDPAFRNAALVDLADPAARDWLRGYQLTAAAELGVDGWMADFAEWLPVEARMHDGESGWRWHNRYPIEWQRANVEAMREAHPDGSPEAGDWTFFVRSGWASTNGGTGGVAPTLWAGDQNTDWGRDDGLPTVIPIGVHAGLAGVAVYGSDIAGYTSETVPNTTKELFFRWAALGAFHPLMRTHHGSDECGNWSFDRDADTLAHYRRHAIIHTLLHPYLRDAMDEAMRDGIPITRHPWLVEPDHPGLWRDGRDLYFLGGALLVAPVVEQGATARVVHLPGDGWWPLFADAPLPGGEAGPGGTVMHDVAAPPTEIPVFVRPGTALPLLPRPVDSFRATAGDGVSTLAELGGARRLALYPRAGAVDTTLGDARVTAAGLAARPDWTTAALDGAPLPACADEAAVSCADAAGVTLRAVGDATVTVGGATITIAGEGTRRDWHLAWAGEAFGALRSPTALGELDPDVPPPCEP
ncbi:MAG: glycoside hydrolase family 31 protein, partial [bacterium]